MECTRRVRPPRRGPGRTALAAVLAAGLVVAPATASSARPAALAGAAPIAAPVLVSVSAPPAGGGPASGDEVVPGAVLDPTKVAATLKPLLQGGGLGPGRTPAHVVDLATGEVLYDSADRPTTPASTTKLVTAVSALEALGPQDRLQTRAMIRNPAAATPRIVLVGGGDPSLSTSVKSVGGAGTSLRPATLRALATATAAAIRERAAQTATDSPAATPTVSPAAESPAPSPTVEAPEAEPPTVRLSFDDSLFTGPAEHPTWASTFPAAGVVAPISALVADEGRRTPTSVARANDPALVAAQRFAAELERAGLRVVGETTRTTLREDSVQVAAVSSPTVAVLVERMLATSDNTYAETLARLAARSSGLEASFTGVAARARQVLDQLGAATAQDQVVDGSGLSRDNALSPSTLTSLLRAHPDGALASGLPVAGATGSLRNRFLGASSAAAGLARLKTGTLTGVSALAGLVGRPDGRLLAVAFVDGETAGGTTSGRVELDRAVAALVSCDCAADPDPGTGGEPATSPAAETP